MKTAKSLVLTIAVVILTVIAVQMEQPSSLQAAPNRGIQKVMHFSPDFTDYNPTVQLAQIEAGMNNWLSTQRGISVLQVTLTGNGSMFFGGLYYQVSGNRSVSTRVKFFQYLIDFDNDSVLNEFLSGVTRVVDLYEIPTNTGAGMIGIVYEP